MTGTATTTATGTVGVVGTGTGRVVRPCRVTIVDVGTPDASITEDPAAAVTHDHALVLVRRGAELLGFVTVDLSDGTASDAHVRAVVAEQLDTQTIDPSIVSDAPVPAASVLPDRRRVTVVVCTRDRPEQLRHCLHALLAPGATTPDTEIVVVDSASATDETRLVVAAVAATDARVLYVREARPGLSRARNLGLATATGEIVAYVDDDVRVAMGWIDGLRRGFGRAAGVVAVTGLVLPYRLDTPTELAFERAVGWANKGALEPIVVDLAARRPASPLFPFDVGGLGSGNNMAFDAATLRRIGGFDDALGTGSPARAGDDLDIFLRVLWCGGAVAREPGAVVWHAHRVDERALERQLFAYGVGFTAFLTKHLLQADTRAAMLRRAPGALARFARLARGASTEDGPALPRRIVLGHAVGLAAGPLLYARARRWAARPVPRVGAL